MHSINSLKSSGRITAVMSEWEKGIVAVPLKEVIEDEVSEAFVLENTSLTQNHRVYHQN